MDETPAGLNNIKTMYEKLTYFDQYGSSVILFIIITIILFLFISYCMIMINIKPISDDWVNQRCKPNIMPFAGLITHPDDVSAFDYTAENFNYCIQNINASISGAALQPLTFITDSLQNIGNQILGDIQNIKGMFDKVRNMFLNVSQEIMGRIMNFMIPLQQILISFKDLLSKIQGVMTAGLYTLLGSYYTLKSLMGAIAQFIVTILITLAILIAVLWAIPFVGWGAAVANTIIFIAISIPMIIILVFMKDVLGVNSGLSIPGVKCFDEDTLITMSNGYKNKIIDIRNGDMLTGNNKVTATFKLEAGNSTMYNLNGITVSDSHIVKYNGIWLPVSKHPNAVKCISYTKPYLYCLNTANKTIVINRITFTDWDEVYGDDINEIKKHSIVDINTLEDCHTYLDGGFVGDTVIRLENGETKEIQDVSVNDVLEYGEKVYGIVKIDGTNVSEQAKYRLGRDSFVEGGPNLTICERNIAENTTLYLGHNDKEILIRKHNELYHILTDVKTLHINGIKFYDYNGAIDLHLERYKSNLLSMKYV